MDEPKEVTEVTPTNGEAKRLAIIAEINAILEANGIELAKYVLDWTKFGASALDRIDRMGTMLKAVL